MEPIEMMQEEIGRMREKLHILSGDVTSLKIKDHLCIKEQDWGRVGEMFNSIDKQLTSLVESDKLRNGRWDEHLKTSVEYRIKVDKHDDVIKDLIQLRWWMGGVIVTIIMAVMAGMLTFGQMINQIRVNTGRLEKLEGILLTGGGMVYNK